VIRCLTLLLALGGCDLAFGLYHDPLPPVCGPFRAPTQVVFDAALVDAHDFSVDETGNFGLVTATASASGIGAWTGPHAIRRDDSGMWVQDVARDKIVLDSLDGAHTISQTEAVGWIDLPSPTVHLYSLSTAWNQVADVIESAQDRSVHIGNVIDFDVGAGQKQRFAPEIRPAAENGQVGEIAILQRNPTSSFWIMTAQARDLNVLDPPVDFNGAVLTDDHEVLLYTGRLQHEDFSRIFASRRKSDEFNVGVELRIDGVDRNSSDLTEPWVAGDCETVYFRWQDQTWMAEAK
jgi:hypothetical protein